MTSEYSTIGWEEIPRPREFRQEACDSEAGRCREYGLGELERGSSSSCGSTRGYPLTMLEEREPRRMKRIGGVSVSQLERQGKACESTLVARSYASEERQKSRY